MIVLGAEQIYRLRDYDQSERVRVVEIDSRKKMPRYVVEFLEGEKQGQRERTCPCVGFAATGLKLRHTTS